MSSKSPSPRPYLGRRSPWLAAAVIPAAFALASCTTEPPANNNGTNTPVTAGNPPEAPAGTSAASQFETPRKPSGEVFVKVITNGISPFWDPMGVGMKKAASELEECKAEWTGPRSSTVDEQKRMVEDALAKGADGIAISCIEAEAAKPIIDMVLAKGIPCITFDADSPTSGRLAYIGTNNFNAGKAAGEAAIKLLPNGGKFVGFVGNVSAQNARERRDGFIEAAKAGKIELLDVMDDNKDAARARRNVEDTLSKRGDEVQGLLGLFSYNGPAISQAVTNVGKRASYKIVAFDAEPATLVELEKGNVDATVVQKPYDFGVLSTKLLYLINRKGWSAAKKELNIPDDGIYDTGVEVITPATVKQYKANLEKLGIKSS